MALKISIDIKPPPGSPKQSTITNLGNTCMEVACTGSLEVKDASGKSYPATWRVSNETVVSFESNESKVGTPWTITGKGFGQVIITATVEGIQEQPEPLLLFVGSVLIVGADDNHWQVYPDGSITRVPDEDLHSSIVTLRNSNAVIADLNGVPPPKPNVDESPSEAVTCYMLNLASFTFDKPKKPR